jgi:hypothetical protein
MKAEIQAMLDYYPRFNECTIQTFDDNKERKESKLARLFHNKKENYKDIDLLNWQWAWIFFSVNPMLPWKRDKASVVGVSSWICEIDWLSKELQKKLIDLCPLKPNLVIESNSSYHLYWFAKDWTIENWTKICNGLRNFFDWDPAVVDISRVLRLPWYNHMKDEKNPFLIAIDDFLQWWYTETEMITAYPNTQSLSDIKQSMIVKESQANKWLGGDYYRDRVKNMDTKTMLQEVSGSSWVNGEHISFSKNNNGTEQIVVNGKSTGAWIDHNGKIGSSAWWWPNWTNWVFWYGNCDWKDLAKWINERHPEMVIDKKIPKKENKEIVKEEKQELDFTTITPFSRWLPSVDEKFGRFERNKFIVTIGESQSWKTEYTFFQARVNANRWYKVCYIALEMNKQNMILRICQKVSWVTKTDWDNKNFTDRQKEKMREKYNELWNYPNLDIVHISSPTIEDIKELIKEKQKKWFELFYIDNLWFITGDMSEIELTPMVVRELKDITNTQPISINLLHHFNKGWAKDRIWPRWMASIRSSGKIENDADYVFQVWRDLDDDIPLEDKKLVWLYLQKDRVWWDPSNIQVVFDKWNYKEYVKWDKKEDPF